MPVVKTVKRLLTEEKGNAEAGLLHGVALNLVDLSGGHSPGLDTARAAAVEKAVELLHIYICHITGCVQLGEIIAEILIGLHDHFFNRHAGHQIGNPLFYGSRGVFIFFHLFMPPFLRVW